MSIHTGSSIKRRTVSRLLVLVLCLTSITALDIFGNGPDTATASATPTAKKCKTNLTPITKVKGFRLVSKTCQSSGFGESTYVFRSTRQVRGEDLINGPSSGTNQTGVVRIASLFDAVRKSLKKKSWSWLNPDFSSGKSVTPNLIWNSYPDCVEPLSAVGGCAFAAMQEGKTTLYYMNAEISWRSEKCFGGGWYACNYRMQITITTSGQHSEPSGDSQYL